MMKYSRYKTRCLLCSHYVITEGAEAHSSSMHRFTLPPMLTEECWRSSHRFCSVMSFIITPVAPAHNWIPAARYKSAVITSVLMLLAQTGRRDHKRPSFSTVSVSWDSSKHEARIWNSNMLFESTANEATQHRRQTRNTYQHIHI